MKIIALLLIIPAMGQAQPKNTERIIIQGVTFKQAINKLLDKGYTIDKIDSTFNTASTVKKSLDGTRDTYVLNARIKDSALYLTGYLEWFMFGNKYEQDIANAGAKGFSPRNAFKKMDEFAKSFGLPVEYEVKK